MIAGEGPARRVLEVGLRQGESAVLAQVFRARRHARDRGRPDEERVLSTAAHELRTPMASVFGFCELLLHRQATPERQREMLQIVHHQEPSMTVILNELLDLARLEARRGTDFRLRSLDVAQLLRDAVETDFQPPSGRSAPELLALTAEARVRVDRNKMHQALANVLSNAYEYSPDGGPVRVRLLPGEPVAAAGDQPAEWGIRIEDAGIGMTPSQLARVSERFYRADASGNIPGTGHEHREGSSACSAAGWRWPASPGEARRSRCGCPPSCGARA